VPARFESYVPADHPAFRYGLALHEAGFHWEAHEVWEAVWRAAPPNGPDAIALRALIQRANAALKTTLGQPKAASRLAAEADDLLSELKTRGPLPPTSVAAAVLAAPNAP